MDATRQTGDAWHPALGGKLSIGSTFAPIRALEAVPTASGFNRKVAFFLFFKYFELTMVMVFERIS
jgi:hypothetical protein